MEVEESKLPVSDNLRSIMAASLAADWSRRCAYCHKLFDYKDEDSNGQLYVKDCYTCNRRNNMNPGAECLLTHDLEWPRHCRTHHGYNVSGMLFKELDECDTCIKVAWETAKEGNIFNIPWQQAEADLQEEVEVVYDRNDYDEHNNVNSEDDSETHSCTPAESELVTMVTKKVIKIDKSTKRSESAVMAILEKVTRLEKNIDKIHGVSEKMHIIAEKVVDRVEDSSNVVCNTFKMNAELINGFLEPILEPNKKEKDTEAQDNPTNTD